METYNNVQLIKDENLNHKISVNDSKISEIEIFEDNSVSKFSLRDVLYNYYKLKDLIEYVLLLHS